jgi:hypothetical protein
MHERMVGYFLNIIHQQGEGFEHYERRSLRTSVIQITLGVTKVRAHCMKCELVQGYFFARPGDHTAAQSLLMNTYKVKASQSPTAAM